MDDQKIEAGLKAVFLRDDESALEAVERVAGTSMRVLLRDGPDDVSPIVRVRRDDETPDDPRYQVMGEIARGGVGVIYKGRDKDLGRNVALKVLRRRYAEDRDTCQRFLEEAQIGGQLQHPGIVPVFGLGLQSDGRPSFAAIPSQS